MEREAEVLSARPGLFFDPFEIIGLNDGATYTITSFELSCQKAFLKCGSLDEYLAVTADILRRMGFTDCSFTRMNTREMEHRMFTTPEALTEHYQHPDISKNDFVLRYCSESTVPRRKSEFDRYIEQANFDIDILRSNRETRQILEGYGYWDYYNLPIPATNGRGNVMLAATARRMAVNDFGMLVDKYAVALRILARTLDHAGTTRIPREFLGKDEEKEIHIKPRALAVLNLMANEGMSVAEVAAALHLSEARVKQLLRAIRDALDARTNMQAVARAYRFGLIN